MKYRLTLGIFARCLGLLYFVSFTHLAFQAKGRRRTLLVFPTANFDNQKQYL